MAIYLKINTDKNVAINYLNYWLEIFLLHGGDIYILCDKEDVVQAIKEKLVLSNCATFIHSNREEELHGIMGETVRKLVP